MSAPAEKTAGPGRRRVFWLILAALLLLAWATAPGLALNLALKRLAEASDWRGAFGEARPGFFLTSLTVAGLDLTAADGASLQIAELRAEGLSPRRLWRLARHGWPEDELALAGQVEARGLAAVPASGAGFPAVSFGRLSVTGLTLNPAAGPEGLPVGFDGLEAREVTVGRPETGGFSLGRLSAERLRPEALGHLKAEYLRGVLPDGAAPPLTVALDSLNLAELHLPTVRRMIRGDHREMIPLWLFQGVERLELAGLSAERDGRSGLRARALFDRLERTGGGPVTYLRRLDAALDLQVLAPGFGGREPGPELAGFLAVTGGRLETVLEMRAAFDQEARTLRLEKAGLEAEGLGRLTLEADVGGVIPVRPGLAPSPLLFSCAGWLLHSAVLAWEDQGLVSRLYPYLKRTEFKNSPLAQTGADLAAGLEPFFAELAAEGGLADLPALKNEVSAFLLAAWSFRIAARPENPLPLMSLAGQDTYGLIQALALGLQVNDRTPVTVGAAPGVFHDRLPRTSRPMGAIFEEDL